MLAYAAIAVVVLLGLYVFVGPIRRLIDKLLSKIGLKQTALQKVDAFADELRAHADAEAKAAKAYMEAHLHSADNASKAAGAANAIKTAVSSPPQPVSQQGSGDGVTGD